MKCSSLRIQNTNASDAQCNCNSDVETWRNSSSSYVNTKDLYDMRKFASVANTKFILYLLWGFGNIFIYKSLMNTLKNTCVQNTSSVYFIGFFYQSLFWISQFYILNIFTFFVFFIFFEDYICLCFHIFYIYYFL